MKKMQSKTENNIQTVYLYNLEATYYRKSLNIFQIQDIGKNTKVHKKNMTLSFSHT